MQPFSQSCAALCTQCVRTCPLASLHVALTWFCLMPGNLDHSLLQPLLSGPGRLALGSALRPRASPLQRPVSQDRRTDLKCQITVAILKQLGSFLVGEALFTDSSA